MSRQQYGTTEGTAMRTTFTTLIALLAASMAAGATALLPPAAVHAAGTPAAGVKSRPFLDVTIKPGSVSIVPLVSVTLTVIYTCADPDTPSTQITVALDQAGHSGSASSAEPCGPADVSKAVVITVPLPLVADGTEITAEVTEFDGLDTVTSSADLDRDNTFLDADPELTFNPDQTITETGSYDCAPADPTPMKLVITSTQENASHQVTAGSAIVNITRCDNAVHHWSVTIKGSISGDGFTSASGVTSTGRLGGLRGKGGGSRGLTQASSDFEVRSGCPSGKHDCL
ncbi:MAG TPA: hypothetical protein VFB06_15795 [Streptosporangiaceae bacterium]|nr:hypothetical protein [Streptosporangiaceae bacterium]